MPYFDCSYSIRLIVTTLQASKYLVPVTPRKCMWVLPQKQTALENVWNVVVPDRSYDVIMQVPSDSASAVIYVCSSVLDNAVSATHVQSLGHITWKRTVQFMCCDAIKLESINGESTHMRQDYVNSSVNQCQCQFDQLQ